MVTWSASHWSMPMYPEISSPDTTTEIRSSNPSTPKNLFASPRSVTTTVRWSNPSFPLSMTPPYRQRPRRGRPCELRAVCEFLPDSRLPLRKLIPAVLTLELMKQNPLSRRSFLTLAGGAGPSLRAAGLVGVPAGAPTKRGVLHLPTTGFSTSHIKGFSNPRITVEISNGERVIHSKSMPAHPIDSSFSYPGGTPTAQNLTFRVSTRPRLASKMTELVTGYTLGVHTDSVTLETASASYSDNVFLGAWN